MCFPSSPILRRVGRSENQGPQRLEVFRGEMYGYDYGIRPTVVAVGDVDFVDAWDKAGYYANAYGFWDHYGVIVNPPFVCMLFENEEEGRNLLEKHFKKWADDSDDGDAVGMAFVEWNDGGYSMIVYPEIQHLIQRCFPDDRYREEVDIITLVPSKAKDFPEKSEFFRVFKRAAQTNPVLFMGGTEEGAFDDLVIRKLHVEFHEEDGVPEHSIAATFKRGRESGDHTEHRERPLEPLEDVFSRRIRNLDKYFPVTLEYLRASTAFADVLGRLSTSGHEEWQVVQAACNLVLSHNLLGKQHFRGFECGDRDTGSIPLHDALRNYVETPYMAALPDSVSRPSFLRRQIKLDSLRLLRARDLAIPIDTRPSRIQRLLQRHGLLSPPLLTSRNE